MTWPDVTLILGYTAIIATVVIVALRTPRSKSSTEDILDGLREPTWKVERKPTRDTKEGGGDE